LKEPSRSGKKEGKPAARRFRVTRRLELRKLFLTANPPLANKAAK